MPAEYVIDAGNRIVWTKFSGVLTRAEVAEHADKLRADPRFEADFAEVVDLREASKVQLGYEDFNALAHVDPFSARSKRTFVVAPAQAAIFELTCMYQIVRGETNIALFDTPEQALEWIQPKK